VKGEEEGVMLFLSKGEEKRKREEHY